ncbi:hypothetical protein Kisp02_47580 [Kineosporia sp. NBRC 101731]|nr:hypothetical protein Kisp02_47580 [Kineosporia sp. NBRC 101731]
MTARVVQVLVHHLDEHRGEAVDRPQRAAQVVRDRIAERLQFLVLALQFLHHRGPGLRDLRVGPGLGRLDLLAQQALPDLPVFVLDLLALQLGPDPGQEHPGIGRAAHVVVGPRVERVDHGLTMVVVADDDQGNVAHTGRRLHLTAHVQAVLRADLQLDQDAVAPLERQQFQRLLPGLGLHHVETLVAQPRRAPGQHRGADGHDLLQPLQAGRVHRGQGHRRLPQRRGQLREHHVVVGTRLHERVRAGVQGGQLGPGVVGGREQQAGNAAQRRVQPDPTDHGGPVDIRQHGVDQHRVGPAHRRVPQPGQPRVGLEHLVTAALQQVGEPVPHLRAVVDHQHPHHVVGGLRLGRGDQLLRPRHQVPGVVRLAQVLVRTGAQAPDPVFHLGLAAEHEHR